MPCAMIAERRFTRLSHTFLRLTLGGGTEGVALKRPDGRWGLVGDHLVNRSRTALRAVTGAKRRARLKT